MLLNETSDLPSSYGCYSMKLQIYCLVLDVTVLKETSASCCRPADLSHILDGMELHKLGMMVDFINFIYDFLFNFEFIFTSDCII